MRDLPDATEKFTAAGVLTEKARLFLLQLSDVINGRMAIRYKEYADLAAISAAVPNPKKYAIYGVVIGQGMAMHNGVNWVRAADDTTLIT